MGGSLNLQEIKTIQNKTNIKLDNFIETGTYKGDTTLLMSKYFNKVYTFEIVKQLYEEAKEKCKEQNNINFYLCDSKSILPVLVPEIKGDSIYFLDAHQSGPDTSHIDIEVPLLQELECILTNNINKNIVIIIDDIRFFTCEDHLKPHDWAHISIDTIEDLINSNNHKIINKFESEHSDRLIYHINLC